MYRIANIGRYAGFLPFSCRTLFSDSALAILAAGNREETGLYGFKVLKTAKGFRRFVDEAIERVGDLVSRISELPPSEEIIKVMDDISNTVCSVIDSAELCRNTHPDRDFVEEANKASMRMSEYMHHLNTNLSLYNAVLITEKEGSMQSEEAQRVAHSLRIDFEKGGIHLPIEKLERVNQLIMEIAQLGKLFNENIIADPGYIDVFPASRIPKNMQHHFIPIYRQSNRLLGLGEKNKVKGFRLATDSCSLSSIMKWVTDGEVRKQAYIMGNSVPRANLAVIDKLISARHEVAQIMGFRSYAEFAIHPNMARSPNVVMSFLLNLNNMISQRVDEEVKLMKDYKRRICNDAYAVLEPWDEAYFTGLMKRLACDLDPSAFGYPDRLELVNFSRSFSMIY
ncbi:hypothetical protein HPP92_002882 [Vanilla planifolia]|uniref:Peptidase M3A/M3B catalytic domain-containing protein n=1 Tax=Vanilla planifolia TaxID=51239 RepID=A0A835VMR8_VANPL|nr:hypothetical protein HPP92_002882 [Vanilla planifolia]